MKQWVAKVLVAAGVVSVLSACGGGGGGSAAAISSEQSQANALSFNPTIGGFAPLPSLNRNLASCKTLAANEPASTITGRLLFERVALSSAASVGLDYSNISSQPARGIVIEAVQANGGRCSDTVVDATISDGAGDYGLIVASGQSVCVRARAQMASAASSGASWNINVSDNARSNSPYYFLLSATPITAPALLGDRVASSGWNNSTEQYTSTRAAAPLSILDTACEALDTVLQRDNSLSLSTLNIRWGQDNKSLEGDLSLGEIGGPFYSLYKITSGASVSFSHNIFLLGDADADTDEYDQHVIAHEFAHFFSQDQSRSDSVGGSHGINDLLDMSVAFEEGFASAFSGITLAAVLPDPQLYRDTVGVGQQLSFSFNLDRRFGSHAGWYSESSAHYVVYNAFDSVNAGADSLSLGFSSIYNAWVEQRDTDASVSLFSFINSLKRQLSFADKLKLDTLVAAENVEAVSDDFGSNEDSSNNPEVSALADVAPVYLTLLVGGPPERACSNPQGQRQNGISVYRRLVLNVPSTQNYTFTLTPVDGGKPKLIVERRGRLAINREQTGSGLALTASATLQAGNHVVRVADVDNVSIDTGAAMTRCFDLSVN